MKKNLLFALNINPTITLKRKKSLNSNNTKYLILKLQQQIRWANTEQEIIIKDIIRGGNVNVNEILINN